MLRKSLAAVFALALTPALALAAPATSTVKPKAAITHMAKPAKMEKLVKKPVKVEKVKLVKKAKASKPAKTVKKI